MRKYITETVGILELFQIIFSSLVMCLGYYAFFIDVSWNRRIEKQGLRICGEINRNIHAESNQTLLKSECLDVLHIIDEAVCLDVLKAEYLLSEDDWKGKNPFEVTDKNNQRIDKKEFILEHMRRRQPSEITFLVITTLIEFLLVMHMIVASFAKAIEVRTKWNAVVQMTVLFSAGFAAMFLAISTNTIDNKYIIFYKEIKICDTLRFCDRSTTAHPDLDKEHHLVMNRVLDDFHACQAVKIKEAICVLLIIIIGTCATMIFLAMDLVTKYEQESEEEEVAITETNVGSLVEDEVVEFDVNIESNDESGTDTEHAKMRTVHGRPSSVVLKEYLHIHGHPNS